MIDRCTLELLDTPFLPRSVWALGLDQTPSSEMHHKPAKLRPIEGSGPVSRVFQ